MPLSVPWAGPVTTSKVRASSSGSVPVSVTGCAAKSSTTLIACGSAAGPSRIVIVNDWFGLDSDGVPSSSRRTVTDVDPAAPLGVYVRSPLDASTAGPAVNSAGFAGVRTNARLSDSPPPSVMLVAHPDRVVAPTLAAITLGPLVNEGLSLTLVIVIEKTCALDDRLPSSRRTETEVDPCASAAGVKVRSPPAEIAGGDANSAVLSASTV